MSSEAIHCTAFHGDIVEVESRTLYEGGVYLDVVDDMGGEAYIALNHAETLALIEALKKHIGDDAR